MKFTAAPIEMDLELTPLGKVVDGEYVPGEDVYLKPKIMITTKTLTDIIRKWSELEKQHEDDPAFGLELMGIQLASVYDKPSEWWLENFEPATLGAIVRHIAGTAGALKKNAKSSKRS